MKKRARIALVALALVGVLGVAGCAGGPSLKASLSFTQGPTLNISFEANPVSTNGVKVLGL